MTDHPHDHEIGSSARFELEKVFTRMDVTMQASPPDGAAITQSGWLLTTPR